MKNLVLASLLFFAGATVAFAQYTVQCGPDGCVVVRQDPPRVIVADPPQQIVLQSSATPYPAYQGGYRMRPVPTGTVPVLVRRPWIFGGPYVRSVPVY